VLGGKEACILYCMESGRNSSEIKRREYPKVHGLGELCIDVMWFEEGDYRNLHLYYKSIYLKEYQNIVVIGLSVSIYQYLVLFYRSLS
jgi:hypothetical protein